MRRIIGILSVLFFMTCFAVSAQKNEFVIKFGLFADVQYADCEASGSRFYRHSLVKLEDCVKCLNEEKLGFTINLGDIVDRKFEEIDSLLLRLNRLSARVYHLTGNHDYSGVSDNSALYGKLNMPDEYYAFEQDGWLFVMLNTNEVASYANIAGTTKQEELSAMMRRIKTSKASNGATWNGGISAKQLDWLDNLLATADLAGQPALIFAHHPLYPPSAFAALNNFETLDVIGKYRCVKAVFAGHHHDGEFAYFRGIPMITAEGMVETADQNSFATVEIYQNKILVKGRGRMSSRKFDLH